MWVNFIGRAQPEAIRVVISVHPVEEYIPLAGDAAHAPVTGESEE
jgi:hypothetical protein